MKTLFIIPKMFTLDELRAVNTALPDDYQAKSKEFWDYIEEKLAFRTIVQKLYYDSLTKEESQEALEFIKENNEQCYNLVKRFTELGARLESTEDFLLVQETASWISMLKSGKSDPVTEEMLEKNMIDRDKYIARIISESLKDGETGILFLAPGRKTGDSLLSDIRVIKIQPFDPSDYLSSWLVSLSLKSQMKNPPSEKS